MAVVITFSISICLVFWRIAVPCAAIPTYREGTEECNSPECQKAAQFLVGSMDTTVDPCQDFFQYTCGNWNAKHPIPEEKFSYSVFYVLYDSLLDTVAEILQNASSEDHIWPVKDCSTFFSGCIDEEGRETVGLDPLRDLLTSLGGWPMATPGWSSDGYQWQTQVANVKRTLNIKPIIAVNVDGDANQTSHHIFYLDQPEQFGLGRNQLVDTNSSERTVEIIAAYKTYIVATAKLLNPIADEKELENEAEEMIQFESKLAQFSKPPEERRDARSWYDKMTLAEVKTATQNTYFEWTDFLNDVLQELGKVTDETKVVLSAKDYIKKSIELASNTNPRILANYIVWIVLKNIGQYTTKQFRDNQFNFQKVELGIQQEEKLKRICANTVIELLGFAVGRLYVDKYFTEEEKNEADEVVENIRSAYKSSISTHTWMDEVTKKKAIEKVDAMINKMGYPPWIKDDKKLQEYYSSVQHAIKRGEFFSSFLKVTKAVKEITLRKWNQPTDRENDWDSEPPVVNAFYSPNSNSITFPAGILQPPFFKNGVPPSLNYGGIGSIIGHEVSHGFDDEGSQFDKEGNLINWWSKETKDKFNEKANCFRTQYSNYVEPATNMSLNGNNTVGENIADNGGVRNALMAYRTKVNSEKTLNKRLPGISATAEQLFFIAYSSMWCGNERPEFTEWSIQYDSHSPGPFRAFIPLTNSVEFAKAFNCPLGSKMNPEEKCLLW